MGGECRNERNEVQESADGGGIWWLSVGRGGYHRHYNRWWLYPFLCLLLLLLSTFLVLRVVSTRREEHLKAY